MNTPSKDVIVSLLRAWIGQRAGMYPREYGNYADYRSESRRITKDRHDAETLLRAVEYSDMTAEQLAAAFPRGFSGRLSLVETPKGWKLEYCTGQYFPTEYRAAACAVLAAALWDYHRGDIPADDPRPGDSLRAKFRRIFGSRIQKDWFN